MELAHFLVALVQLILLMASLHFRRSFVLHIFNVFITIWFIYFAIINEWEIFFFPIFALCEIAFLLLIITVIKDGGNWI